jgi:CRISPR-associated protein Cas1
VVRKEGRVIHEVVALHVDRIVVMGNVHLTTPTVAYALDQGVDVVFLSAGGAYRGRLEAPLGKDARLRQAQYRMAQDEAQRLAVAKKVVAGKLSNMVALWRRQQRARAAATTVPAIQQLVPRVERASSLSQLRGYEGSATAAHFAAFRQSVPPDLGFERRVHHPPSDPTNALLSLGYTLLHNELRAVTSTVGLDPYQGFYHDLRHGHAALASDMMEEWRPVVVDALVLSLLHRGELVGHDFRVLPDRSVRLTRAALEGFLHAYDERLRARVQHRALGQRLSYRQCLAQQAKRLAGHIRGEEAAYEPFHWR